MAVTTVTTMISTSSGSSITTSLVTMPQMQKERQNGRPHEEERLHDTHRKRRLQHRTALIQLAREWIPRLLTVQTERAQRFIDGIGAAVPVVAVG